MKYRSILEKWLSGLSENDFRIAVLMPLFKELGYQNVTHYHGSSRELGKDIVMWKSNDFRKRENYAVIVKAGKITGSVTGKGTFTEITTQVQQAFGSSYRDESSLVEIKIDHCLIAVNRPTKKEAIEAIYAQLGELTRNRLVTFLDFNTLVDYMLIYKIGPNTIDSLGDLLDTADPSGTISDIRISRQKGKTEYAISFDKNTPQSDLTGMFALRFPGDKESHEFEKKYQEFVDFGKSLEIPKEYIASFDMPNAFTTITFGGDITKIILGPVSNPFPVQLDLIAENNFGQKAILPNLRFEIPQHGKKMTMFEHNEIGSPFSISLKIFFSGTMNITYSLKDNLEKISVLSLFRYFKFIDHLYTGGKLILLEAKEQIRLLSASTPREETNRPDAFWLSIYEKCAYIQEHTNRVLYIPKEGLKEADIKDIVELYAIISEGRINSLFGTFTLNLAGDKYPERLNETEGLVDLDIAFSVTKEYVILGETIDIGEARYLIHKAQVKHSQRKDEVEVILLVKKDYPATVIYPKYYKKIA